MSQRAAVIGSSRSSRAALLGILALSLLAACADMPKPLYHWGGYPTQVYEDLKGETSSEEQLQKMELMAAQAAGTGAALPPGFRAHMAMLHLRLGREAQARQLMQMEGEAFPEGQTFMSFLMKDKSEQKKEMKAATKDKSEGRNKAPAGTPSSGGTRR